MAEKTKRSTSPIARGARAADGRNPEEEQGNGVGHLTASIGTILRNARGGRFTIEQLAARSGVSAGRISQVERGKANPSFATLWKLAKALEMPFGSFFDDVDLNAKDPADSARIVRVNERKRISLPHDDLLYELLTPDTQGRLEVFRFKLPPHFDNSRVPLRHEGEELIHVLSGTLVMSVGGIEYELHEGDSITYDADLPHYNLNRTDQMAVALAAVTPPSF